MIHANQNQLKYRGGNAVIAGSTRVKDSLARRGSKTEATKLSSV